MEYPRMIRAARWILFFILGAGFLYLLCLLFPQPFFSHSLRRENIIIYTRDIPPPGTTPLLDSVAALLRRSPLNDTSVTHRVFLCHSQAQFVFFTRGRANLGGLCDDRLTRNIFIHPADLATGRMIAPPGWPYRGDDRPLSYFIAHEITHSLESRFVGRWNVRVPAWLWEGYADYIGMNAPLDGYLQRYREGSPFMNPAHGLYDRYALYVAYLLDYEHRDIREVLGRPPAVDSVEEAVRRLAWGQGGL